MVHRSLTFPCFRTRGHSFSCIVNCTSSRGLCRITIYYKMASALSERSHSCWSCLESQIKIVACKAHEDHNSAIMIVLPWSLRLRCTWLFWTSFLSLHDSKTHAVIFSNSVSQSFWSLQPPPQSTYGTTAPTQVWGVGEPWKLHS